jgi:hypothetical protein
MSKATKQQINSAKAILEPEANTKLIDCPAHPGQHQAVLYCYGHQYAGVWECYISGESDSHDHQAAIELGKADREIETGESWPTGPEDSGHEFSYYICGGREGCGLELDGDPELDRAEAEDEGYDRE